MGGTISDRGSAVRRVCVHTPGVTGRISTNWLPALASIGSGLSMSKEYRDVFEDLIEKVRTNERMADRVDCLNARR